MKIALRCSACGGNRLSLDRACPDCIPVVGEDCRHGVGTLGSLKLEVARVMTGERSMAMPLKRS